MKSDSLLHLADFLFNTWGGRIGIAFCLIIVGLFSWCWRKYFKPLSEINKALNTAQTQLAGRDSDFGAKLFSSPDHLKDLWREYLSARDRSTIIVDGEPTCTLDIEEIFTENAVLGGYNRSMAVAVAGILTGLGILGTFVGLIIGMFGLGTEIGEIVQNIGSLLSGMWAAFLTSVFGIGFSLVWLSVDRRMYHAVHESANRFFNAVRARHPVESPDRVLHRLLALEGDEKKVIEESHLLLDEQNSILRTLSFDLASHFAETLDSTLTQRLTPALEAMTETLNSLSVQIGERYTDAMEQMVTSFQDRLSRELGGHFEGLSQSLERTAEWQEQVHDELGSLIEKVQMASDSQLEVIQQSRNACDLFSNSLEELGAAHDRIAEASEVFSNVGEEVRAEVSSLLETFSERLNQLKTSLTTAFENSAEKLASTTERLELETDRLALEHEAYREANSSIRTELAQQIDLIDEQVEALSGFWTNFRDDLERVGKGLKDSVSTFGSVTEDKLRQIFASFDSEMAKVVEHLGGTLAEMREITDELPASVQRLHLTLRDSIEPISVAGHAVNSLADSLRALENLPDAVSSLSPLNTTVQEAVNRVASAENAMSSLTERMAEIDRTLESWGNDSRRLLAEVEAQTTRQGEAVTTTME